MTTLWFDRDGGRLHMMRRLLETHEREQGRRPMDFWVGFFAGWLATMCAWNLAVRRR